MKLSTRPSLLTSAITALVVIIPGCAPHSPHSAETVPQTSPLGPFASLPPSQWKMGTTSNVGMYDTWMWGPGYHSIRVMTHNDSDPDTTPWRAVQAIYRNPATNKLHAWSINPYAHSVDEGVITVTPNSAECTSDLYQTNIHRFLTRRWTFESAEIHHLALLEAHGVLEAGRDGEAGVFHRNAFRQFKFQHRGGHAAGLERL